MENKKALENRLKNIFNRKESLVVMLSGQWGVGKTYFWHKFQSDCLDNKKVAYISLFGKSSIDSIREDISIQVADGNNLIKKGKDITEIVKIPYINLASALSLFTKKEFENIVVCFDDFERLSDELSLNEVLGLIAELKEQKECKVMMILNQKKLKEGKTLTKYKEKIIDYEFQYRPTPSESFGLIQHKLTTFKTYPLEDYFQTKGINNIRIIRRVINALNDFSFIEGQISDNENVKREVVGRIVEISVINAQSISLNFTKLLQYHIEKVTKSGLSVNSDFKRNKKYDDLLSFIDGEPSDFLGRDLAKCLIEYSKTSIVDEKEINKIITDRITNQDRYEIYNKIHKVDIKHRYDMNYKKSQYVSDLWNIMKKNRNNIVFISHTYLNSRNFIFYINKLKKLDKPNQDLYHNFAVKFLKKVLDENVGFMDTFGTITTIEKFDLELRSYNKKINIAGKQREIDSKEKIIILMSGPVKNRGWGDREQDLLAQVTEKMIEKYILESSDFLMVSYNFLNLIGKSKTVFQIQEKFDECFRKTFSIQKSRTSV